MKESEYKRLRRQIEDDYHKKIEALELVWEMAVDAASKKPKRKAPGKRQSKGVADELVGSALEAFAGHSFTVKHICEWIEDHEGGEVDRSTLSHKLRTLAEKGKIEIEKEGKGRAPTVYRRVPSRAQLVETLEEYFNLHDGDRESTLAKYGVSTIEEIEKQELSEMIELYEIW